MAQGSGETAPTASPSVWAVVWDWTKTLLLSVLIALALRAVVVESKVIDGSCMEPTLTTGQRVFYFKPVYWFHGPDRGDIVVFRYPLNPKKDYIKRVIGLSGETIAIRNGIVYIDGQVLDQSAWPVTIDTRRYPEIPEQIIPAGHYFVMGDNRPESEDSRVWGFLPRENVKGRAFVLYWPIWQLKWIW